MNETLTPTHVRLPAALVRAERQSRSLVRNNPGDPDLKELHVYLLEAIDAVEIAFRVAARVRLERARLQERVLDPELD